MRNRFLGTDFFNSAPIETLGFLQLFPPIFPPSCISTVEDLLRCFDHLSVLEISLGLEKLPIETSLNKFFSDVLPQPIHVQIGGFEDDLSCGENACSRESRSFSVDRTLDVDATLLGKDERTSDAKVTNDIKIIQFEVPEIHPFSKKDYDFHCQIAANMKVFSEISNVESESGMPSFELWRQDFFDIQQAICSVDSILTLYFMEQNADLLEDSGFTGGQLDSSHIFFPVFEIEEESLVIFNDISVGEELKTFDYIEDQTWMKEHEIPSNEKELLDSKEFDLLVYLSNHCPAVQVPKVDSNFSQEIDFISDFEDSDIGPMLLFHQGISQDALFGSRNVILFEEFEFTSIELYSFVEVFRDLGIVFTTQHCDLMFSEAMKFKSFNDLIVSNELILVNESFKSLPVPILSESQKILSLHSLSEKMLSALEPESSSSFDGLYLDWHILEEDKSGRYLPCWKK